MERTNAIFKRIFGIIALATIVCAVYMLSACAALNSLFDDWLTKNQREITDAAMARLCSAVAEGDAEAVKAAFSRDDVAAVENFDDEVQKLLDYITGDNITFERRSSGSDEAAMGSYPREREFGGVRYAIYTSTDSYKAVFGYRSYYSENKKTVNTEKIGFTYFDIINEKNDRACIDRLYSGCPFNYMGINFDYTTNYVFCPEEYDYKTAFTDTPAEFSPVIISDAAELEIFYRTHKDEYALTTREDGKGYSDIAKAYDDAFFAAHSLYIVGIPGNGTKYSYSPQFLYIGDFVLVNIVAFEYDQSFADDKDGYTASGAIVIVELPEKIPNDTDAILDLSYFGY